MTATVSIAESADAALLVESGSPDPLTTRSVAHPDGPAAPGRRVGRPALQNESDGPPPLSLETPVVRFFGRALAEYVRFFALERDLVTLRGRRVLDVAAGPASFAVEAGELGIDVTAVDPLYGCTPGTLEAYVKIDYATMFKQLRVCPGLVRCGPVFGSIDEAEADRRAAAARFLDDYDGGFVSGRYVGARLPALPFADGEFDLVLCGHLLFLHVAQFDAAFHLAACREMMRVSRGEVRIHPVCGPDGLPYAKLAALCDSLAAEGIRAREVPVDYAFFNGAESMLVLERA